MKKTICTSILVNVLLLTTAGIVLAWPDQPPDRATISGPGLQGGIEITDKDMLAALKLGAFEDLEHGPIAAPQVNGEGYTIKRWFYDGTFNFATLRYYPDPAGGRGYVQWEDGPDLSGDHTPYNGQWLRTTSQGEAAMQKLLTSLGVSLNGKPQSLSNTGVPALGEMSAAPFIIGGLAFILVVTGVLIWRALAMRPATQRRIK